MKNWIFVLLICAASLPFAAYASNDGKMSADDFICDDLPIMTFNPNYFKMAVHDKHCKGDGAVDTTNYLSICTMPVFCLSKVEAKGIASDVGQDFDQMSTSDQIKFVQNLPHEKKFLSELICQSTNPGAGDTACPKPQDCAGDINYHAQVGKFADAVELDMRQRAVPYNPHSFEHKSAQPVTH